MEGGPVFQISIKFLLLEGELVLVQIDRAGPLPSLILASVL